MRRFMTAYVAHALLLLSARVALGRPPQVPFVTQVATEAASAYDAKNWTESARPYGQIGVAAATGV
jgi:hypothetical protein